MGRRKSTTIKPKTSVDLASATTLRKEFDASKITKNYQTIERSERGMRAAYEMSLKPDIKSKVGSDQALAVLFQKMLDPDSVVRESEYARTPEGIGIMNRVESYLPQLQKGGLAISDDDRKALYDMADKLLQESKKSMNTHIARYEKLSGLYKVPSEYVLGNIQPFDMEQDTQPQGRVKVVGPNGEVGTMDAAQYQEAQKHGWRQVK
jgi:hypothetical protein